MSFVVEEEHLYGCFSPHGPSSQPNESVTPQREGMYMITARALDLELSVDVDARTSLLLETDGHVVAKSGVLSPVPGAFVAREICVFFATLAAAYPGYMNSEYEVIVQMMEDEQAFGDDILEHLSIIASLQNMQ
ncbi:hypothetical protein QYE76_037289 [Lolium multiflorum]|uniref:Uncharacterized protein n=1 Tax=Lolium multiflorum TaxID=4521 RepID=A0AAD8Q8Z1_LOLMU|nr:hypothetical protein QYE76_037289 [Lolium multiflorum]